MQVEGTSSTALLHSSISNSETDEITVDTVSLLLLQKSKIVSIVVLLCWKRVYYTVKFRYNAPVHKFSRF